MQSLTTNPAFQAYVTSCLVLSANLLFLWGWSGAVRARTKTAINPEDARTVSKGAEVVATDPPEVARVLRAHRNAHDNIVPFLFLGLVFVLLGGAPLHAQILFGVFTAARLVHSVVYLRELQPYRTLFFVIGGLTTLVLLLEDAVLCYRACCAG
jgi:uncharacterized MAPEG superfamily protein